MSTSKSHTETPSQVMAMHPRKFLVWLFIVTIVMIFASLTSAYVVKQSEGNWLIFDLPRAFIFTSIVVALSSVAMHWAYMAAGRDRMAQVVAGLAVALVLSLVFLVGQWVSWRQLVEQQVFFVGNPAGSFIYVLTGVHAAHLLLGIVFLSIVLISALKNKVHSKKMVLIEMCATFWHFLSGLWIYLYVFLLLNN